MMRCLDTRCGHNFQAGQQPPPARGQRKWVGVPGCEGLQGWNALFQAGQPVPPTLPASNAPTYAQASRRVHVVSSIKRSPARDTAGGLTGLEVSGGRARDAFPGGPKAHLREGG